MIFSCTEIKEIFGKIKMNKRTKESITVNVKRSHVEPKMKMTFLALAIAIIFSVSGRAEE